MEVWGISADVVNLVLISSSRNLQSSPCVVFHELLVIKLLRINAILKVIARGVTFGIPL